MTCINWKGDDKLCCFSLQLRWWTRVHNEHGSPSEHKCFCKRTLLYVKRRRVCFLLKVLIKIKEFLACSFLTMSCSFIYVQCAPLSIVYELVFPPFYPVSIFFILSFSCVFLKLCNKLIDGDSTFFVGGSQNLISLHE